MSAETVKHTALTLAVAGIGALIFAGLGLPAPFLTGPALAVTLAALAGLPTLIPDRLKEACFVILGINIGSTVTPEVLETVLRWPISFAILFVTLLLIIYLSRAALQIGFGFDKLSAFMASVPGHLSYVLALSSDSKADVAQVSLVQSIRVLSLTLLVPAALGLSGAIQKDAFSEREVIPALWLAVLIAGALLLGVLFHRLAVPAALLLAGIGVTAVAELSGVITGTLPAPLGIAAFLVLGALIGTRFRGQTLTQLRHALGAGIAGTVIATGIAALGALMVATLIDLPLSMVLIAFAPGGLETMAAMAIQTGVDPTFVAAHHVIRLMMLTFLVPILMRRL